MSIDTPKGKELTRPPRVNNAETSHIEQKGPADG
jgi:hypothetical protein